jgi:deoxyribonuclease V
MKLATLHEWPTSTTEARELQTRLAHRVDTSSPLKSWDLIAAADVSYNKFDPWLYAAVVVVKAGTFEVVERVGVARRAAFPYVPGLLSFREAPAVLEAFERVRNRPDVVLCDGQGVAHPRRMGLASHLGLWLGLPTVGCAKSRLTGEYEEPGPEKGARSPLVDRGEVVGSVVRTRARVKPLFVSSGHRIDLESAVAVVLGCAPKYRVPVPARLAHEFVNAVRVAAKAGRPISHNT